MVASEKWKNEYILGGEEMKKSIAAEGGYHDGKKYYKKKTKGKWLKR